MLGAVLWECRAVRQNASHNPPPLTPPPHLDNRLKCSLESVFVRIIFEGVQLTFVGKYKTLIIIFGTPVQNINVNLQALNQVVEN